MKFIAFLYLIFFVHVKASFFDDFRGAMQNVERGFEKLLSDVVTDMKDTIDCTILAVEHVLYINGVYKEPSNYSERCTNSAKSTPTYNVKNPEHKTILQETTTLSNIVRQTDHAIHKDVISEHLKSSISSVNKTLFSIIDDHETTKKIKSISETLKNETNHLTKVSNLLRLELEKISKDDKNKVTETSHDVGTSKDSIWKEIKMLHDIENTSHNNSEVQEVHDVLEETLKELKSDDHYHEDNMDEIIKELEKDLTHTHDTNFESIHRDVIAEAYKDIHGRFDDTDINDSENIKKSIFNHESDTFNNFDHFFNPDVNSEHDTEVEQANKIISDSLLAEKLFGTS